MLTMLKTHQVVMALHVYYEVGGLSVIISTLAMHGNCSRDLTKFGTLTEVA